MKALIRKHRGSARIFEQSFRAHAGMQGHKCHLFFTDGSKKIRDAIYWIQEIGTLDSKYGVNSLVDLAKKVVYGKTSLKFISKM